MRIEKFAAIDIGSNAVRILIANVINRKGHYTYQKNALVRVPIRLGEDAFVLSEISHYNFQRLVKAMKAFDLLMQVHEVKKYAAYATSALRSVENKDEIIEKVLEESGIQIEIISGKKEAEVISRTSFSNFIDRQKIYLYVDVGGGSTEISLYKNGKISVSKSFKIGTVRLINHLVDKELWDKMKTWIKTHTSKYKKVNLLGTGGNINKLHKLANLPESKPLSYLKLYSFYQELNRLSYTQRIIKYRLNPDRSDVIIPAMQIYMNVLNWSKAKAIFVPKTGLADGMIKELIFDDKKKSL
ncbi:MAG: exopolyphosphatase [Flavobacteriaceae bacterium]|nr:exopolyphosphatase [Flavobacteriaceae bacterium]